MQEHHYLVPAQQQGIKKDIEHLIPSSSIDDAQNTFVDAKDKMLDVNNWNRYCPGMSVEFRLTDSHGMGLGQHARKGNLVRVAKSSQGGQSDGFGWLHIDAIEYDDYPDLQMETFAIRLKTADDPQHKNAGVPTAHPDTFTLVIERRASKLYVSYHARNHHSHNIVITDGEWKDLMKSFFE